MPEEAYWETLFDVPLILDRLEINGSLRNVVELGYGTAHSRCRWRGASPALLRRWTLTRRWGQRAAAEGLRNVVCHLRDVMSGFGGELESRDACLLLVGLLWTAFGTQIAFGYSAMLFIAGGWLVLRVGNV